ncbi:MAG: hypothetical protein ACRC7N_04815 [Clostridium sp.]
MSKIRDGESAAIKNVRKGEKAVEKGIKNIANTTDNLYHDIKNSSFMNNVENAMDEVKDKYHDIKNDLKS